ncbi:XRE family transcriptional regulator [Streptomyces sp. NPDC001904]|uniref:XRE family transcriptional regulator n=1 Tax=Streptomyces sp. NPDC001904 TaxID=3154531 RepID=UPI0033176EAF
MPRWRALPDELDPQVKEFAGQLRRLVDRSGLGIAALADRTGYSKTSWERYLNGRLLAPKGAIVALAEVTGTNPVHLTTLWELAERAWSRSEMRHDMTMEAIRISQARAALGEFGSPADPSSGARAKHGAGRNGQATADRSTGVAEPVVAPASSGVPPQGRAPALDRFGPPPVVSPEPPDSGGQGGRRRLFMVLAGGIGAALVVLIAYLLTSGGDGKGAEAAPSKSPATSAPQLPAGVQCVGDGCTGKDPEAMGCGGDLADSPTKAAVGTAHVEVRYSKTCKAAWARIQFAAPGDSVTLSVGAKTSKKGLVGDADTDAYTPMIAVGSAAEAKACGALAAGQKGCTP